MFYEKALKKQFHEKGLHENNSCSPFFYSFSFGLWPLENSYALEKQLKHPDHQPDRLAESAR